MIDGEEAGERFSLVEVPASRADEIIAALRTTTIRGRKVPVRRDRDAT
jgi:ATP-dependent RNA helicase DeaD